MSRSFIDLGEGADETSYFRSIIEETTYKIEQTPYAERRAFALNEEEGEDFILEDEL